MSAVSIECELLATLACGTLVRQSWWRGEDWRQFVARQLQPGYRVERLGPPMLNEDGRPEGISIGRVDALVKDYDPSSYEIANEYVCARLAAGIGLPVPPGDFAEVRDNDQLCWISPLFAAESPPPPDVEDLCLREPKAAAGTVVFDVWIGNLDRHDHNILYTPRQGVSLIDHGQALYFRGSDPVGGLKAAADMCLTSHLLAPYVSKTSVGEWCATVEAVPKRMIAGAIGPVERNSLVDSEHAKALVEFLEYRARRIKALVRRIDWPPMAEDTSDLAVLDVASDGARRHDS